MDTSSTCFPFRKMYKREKDYKNSGSMATIGRNKAIAVLLTGYVSMPLV